MARREISTDAATAMHPAVGGPLSLSVWMPLPPVLASEARAARRGGMTPRTSRPPGESGGGVAAGAAYRHGGHGLFEVTPDYEPGNWDHRGRFLPTIEGADDNPLVAARMHRCVQEGDLTGAKLLLHAGVHPDLPVAPLRRAALHLAAERNDTLMCQLLLSFSADPKQLDATPASQSNRVGGWTPMDIAKERNYIPLIHLFAMSIPRTADRLNGSSHSSRRPSLDLGPTAPPKRPEKPLRLTPLANEPNFMARPQVER